MRQRVWALHGVVEVMATWMRLLYPSEAANPKPTMLMSTQDLLKLVFSPHSHNFMGLLNGFYSIERATETCGGSPPPTP